MGSGSAGRNYWATATVTIWDDDSAAVEGATVYGSWSGATQEDQSDVTDATGMITFTSSKVKDGGTFTFTVTDVVKTDWTYDPAKNKETSDWITLP